MFDSRDMKFHDAQEHMRSIKAIETSLKLERFLLLYLFSVALPFVISTRAAISKDIISFCTKGTVKKFSDVTEINWSLEKLLQLSKSQKDKAIAPSTEKVVAAYIHSGAHAGGWGARVPP